MSKKSWFCSLVFCLVVPVLQATAAPIGNEIVYQIITDRFHDGDPGNNCGQTDLSLNADQKLMNRLTCDPSRRDWNKYWGGDFDGIVQKLDYLKSMGITQIWISPVIENARGVAVGDGTLKTAYHGFWGRDWFRLNEHWTQKGVRDFASFDRLVSAAAQRGIGVVLDSVANHSSPAYDAEWGAVYRDGSKVTDYVSNEKNWFHTQPAIAWDLVENAHKPENAEMLKQYVFQHELRLGRVDSEDFSLFEKRNLNELRHYMLENYKLADLADFDTAQPPVFKYLREAHQFWISKGISGFRFDTIRHVPRPLWKQFVREIRAQKADAFLVGEWYGGGPGDEEFMRFAAESDMSLFDFKLREEMRRLFLEPGEKAPLKRFSEFLQLSVDPVTLVDRAKDLVTFVDNHDMPRMQSEGASNQDVLEMLKLLYGLRGVPCLYYGIEEFLYDKTNGGRDPYNRSMMKFPSNPAGVTLIQKLSAFRKQHPALRWGTTLVQTSANDRVVVTRSLDQDKVLVVLERANAARTGKSAFAAPPQYREVDLGQSGGGVGKTSRWRVRYFTASESKSR